jgi:hypothetical protein
MKHGICQRTHKYRQQAGYSYEITIIYGPDKIIQKRFGKAGSHPKKTFVL